MFTTVSRTVSRSGVRNFKVAVLGASGGIGQPLSLLLKLDTQVTELALFDVVRTPGVAADVGHIATPAKVTAANGMEEIGNALKGCKVVVIPAGVPRKPGMTRDDLFNTNAGIVSGLAEACAAHCPDAMFLIIANPVNSTVPIFAEVLKKHNVYNKKHLFGITTLDVVRANAFVADNLKISPIGMESVTVVGGHAGTTILPLLSQVKNGNFSDADIKALTHRIQFGGDEVVQAKDGAGSATLSMAHAGAYFTNRLLSAMSGKTGIVECAFVENSLTAAPFFSSRVTLSAAGAAEVHPIGTLSAAEQSTLDAMIPDLVSQAKKGVEYVEKNVKK